jgi:hypothetical protein
VAKQESKRYSARVVLMVLSAIVRRLFLKKGDFVFYRGRVISQVVNARPWSVTIKSLQSDDERILTTTRRYLFPLTRKQFAQINGKRFSHKARHILSPAQRRESYIHLFLNKNPQYKEPTASK